MGESEKQDIKNLIKDFKNPYVGLRPFRSGESDLFFGRDEQVDSVVEKLLIEQFVVVTGASGIGKSSLVNCGVIPEVLNRGSWKKIYARISSTFLDDLLGEIASVTNADKSDNKNTDNLTKKSRIFNYLKKDYKDNKTSYLLFIDQFEQIFLNFGVIGEEKIKEARALYISTLVELIKQVDFPVYIIMTMSSDYIGEFTQFNEFTELLNKGNYLLPQMEKENLRRAIEGPLEVADVDWDHRLVDRIISDLDTISDKLPVLQHVLQRTFDAWKDSDIAHKPISIASYENVGTATEAISNHADDAFEELDKKDREICERIFKSITMKTPDHRAVRMPTTIKELTEITQVDQYQIIKIVKTFNRKDRSFLTPSHDTPLKQDTVINLSHEALIRNWERLKNWVEQEASSVQMYKRLANAALQFQLGKTDLWRPPDLELAIKWKEINKPNLAWGRRHNPAYERTMVFLDLSENEYFLEQENKTRKEKLKQKLIWISSIVAGAAAVLLLVLLISSKRKANDLEANYQDVENERKLAEISREEAEEQLDRVMEESPSEDAGIDPLETDNVSTNQNEASLSLPGRNEQTQETRDNVQQNIEDERQDPVITEQDDESDEITDVVNPVTPENTQEEESTTAEEDVSDEITRETTTPREEPEPEESSAINRSKINSINNSLVENSLSINNDADLKALLAYQAYKFNSEYNNNAFVPAIYSALYQSMKAQLGNSFAVFPGHTKAIRTLEFLPGTSSFFTAGSDGTILKWNAKNENKEYATILSGRSVISKIELTKNGRWLLAAENRNGVLLINLASGNNQPDVIKGEDLNIRSIATAPDNRTFYTSGLNNYIEKCNISTKETEKIIDTESRINSIAISPDGSSLAGCTRSGKIIVWRLTGSYPENIIRNSPNDPVLSVTYSPNGRYLACGTQNGKIILFRTSDYEVIEVLSGHTARVTEIDFSPNSRYFVTSGYDGNVLYWNLNNTDSPVTLEDNGGFVFSVSFSPDGSFIASGSAQENRLVVRPASAAQLAEKICFLVSRNMTQTEWNNYVGNDIPYQKTCTDK